MPDRSDPKGQKAYDEKISANTEAIRATGEFFLGLAFMEEIDLDAWNSGKKDQPWVPRAIEHLKKAQEGFRKARAACANFQAWFPKERREEVTPDIDHFHQVDGAIGEVASVLGRSELPSLTQIHKITASMREEQIVGERKAVALRGTTGHFPAGHP